MQTQIVCLLITQRYRYNFLLIYYQIRFSVVHSLAPPILIALGGAIEGLFAETVFDQKIHAFAVILFNAGFWLELNMIATSGSMLSDQCNTKYIL